MATDDEATVDETQKNALLVGEELAQVKGDYTSPAGIWVEVDARGRTTELRLAESLSTVPPQALASMILEATIRAVQIAEQRASTIISKFKSDATFSKSIAMIENITLGRCDDQVMGTSSFDTVREPDSSWLERA